MVRGLIVGTLTCIATAVVAWGPTSQASGGTTPVAASPSASPAPAGVVISVAIFPDRRKRLSLKPNPYAALAAQLNAEGPFAAWVVDDSAPCPVASCRLSDARIYVYGSEEPAADGQPGSLAFTSYFVRVPEMQRIGVVALAVTTANGVSTVPGVSEDQIRTLVGHLALDDNFQVVLSVPGTESALQLVPVPVDQLDPDYEPILEHIFETFGVAATRSTLPANALRGPSDRQTCPGAQRYFVYRVRMEEYRRRLLARSRLEAYAEGYVLDCTAPGKVAAATATSRTDVTRFGPVVTPLTALGIVVAPKLSWTGVISGANAFATIVDVDPQAKNVRDSVASEALAQLVNNTCIRLLQQQSPGLASPPPLNAAPKGVPAPPTVEPLQCRPRIPRRQAGASPEPRTLENVPFERYRDQWLGRTPEPHSSP